MSMSQTARLPTRVRQVARLIRSMSEQERVGWFRRSRNCRQAPNVLAPQADLMAHFQPRLNALDGARPMTDADPLWAA